MRKQQKVVVLVKVFFSWREDGGMVGGGLRRTDRYAQAGREGYRRGRVLKRPA